MAFSAKIIQPLSLLSTRSDNKTNTNNLSSPFVGSINKLRLSTPIISSSRTHFGSVVAVKSEVIKDSKKPKSDTSSNLVPFYILICLLFNNLFLWMSESSYMNLIDTNRNVLISYGNLISVKIWWCCKRSIVITLPSVPNHHLTLDTTICNFIYNSIKPPFLYFIYTQQT